MVDDLDLDRAASPIEMSSPESVELATWVSLATRVPPVLLRAARLTFLPRSGPHVEAELWFGPLVETRGSSAIVLRPEIAAHLRANLARREEDPARKHDLSRAKELLGRLRRRPSQLVRLEEELVWNALAGGETGAATVERTLRSVIKAIVEDRSRSGLARWAFGLRRRIPEIAGAGAAIELELIAQLLLQGSADGAERVALSDDVRAMVAQVIGSSVEIGVRSDGESIGFHRPPLEDDDVITVPESEPAVLVLRSDSGVGPDDPVIALPQPKIGEPVSERRRAALPATVTSMTGDRYNVRSLRTTVASFRWPSVAEIREPGARKQLLGYGILAFDDMIVTTAAVLSRPKPRGIHWIDRDWQVDVPALGVSVHASQFGDGKSSAPPQVDGFAALRLVKSVAKADDVAASSLVGERTVVARSWAAKRKSLEEWASFAMHAGAPSSEALLSPSRASSRTELERYTGSPVADAETGALVGLSVMRGRDLYVVSTARLAELARTLRFPDASRPPLHAAREPSQKCYLSHAAGDEAVASRIASIIAGTGADVTSAVPADVAGFSAELPLGEYEPFVVLLSTSYQRNRDVPNMVLSALVGRRSIDDERRLTVLRIDDVKPSGILATLPYWDLVPVLDKPEELARMVQEILAKGRSAKRGRALYREPDPVLDPAVEWGEDVEGRVDILLAIGAALSDRGDSGVELFGLGGLGKSAIARAYASRNRDRYSAVWWIGAATDESIARDILRLERHLVPAAAPPNAEYENTFELLDFISSALEKPMLLVFDDMGTDISEWRVQGAHVLITSRRSGAWRGVNTLVVHPWPRAEAVAYVHRATRIADADANMLADVLGGFEYALAQAVSALDSREAKSAGDYVGRLDRFIQSPPKAFSGPSLATVIGSGIEESETQAAGSAALLCFAAFFGVDDAPEELFHQPVEYYPDGLRPDVIHGAGDLHSAVADSSRLEAGMRALERLSLLQHAPARRAYVTSRLVRRVARRLVNQKQLTRWAECAVSAADSAMPDVERAPDETERFLPPAIGALRSFERYGRSSRAAAQLAVRCGLSYRYRGAFQTAESLYRLALSFAHDFTAEYHSAIEELTLLSELLGRSTAPKKKSSQKRSAPKKKSSSQKKKKSSRAARRK